MCPNSSPFLCGYGVMGDHFVLLVDRLLTESTLEAAIESINHGPGIPLPTLEDDYSPTKKIIGDGVFTGKMVECRICQDEDEDIRMEIPCSCCGSLKVNYSSTSCLLNSFSLGFLCDHLQSNSQFNTLL